MKFLSVAVFVVICAFAVADEHYDHYAHPKYEFKYGVKDLKTGDIKDQWEHRDGDQVKGAYTLKEADGTTRVVEYHADGHSGFHAEVKNIGQAHHAEEHHHHQHSGHQDDHQEHYAHHVQHDAHQEHYAHHEQQGGHQEHYVHHVQHNDHHDDGGWEDQQHHSHDHGHGHVKSYIDVHHY